MKSDNRARPSQGAQSPLQLAPHLPPMMLANSMLMEAAALGHHHHHHHHQMSQQQHPHLYYGPSFYGQHYQFLQQQQQQQQLSHHILFGYHQHQQQQQQQQSLSPPPQPPQPPPPQQQQQQQQQQDAVKPALLAIIDKLRERKARPDVDRICSMLTRHHGLRREAIVELLDRLVADGSVLRVEYKGSVSYRNAARWHRSRAGGGQHSVDHVAVIGEPKFKQRKVQQQQQVQRQEQKFQPTAAEPLDLSLARPAASPASPTADVAKVADTVAEVKVEVDDELQQLRQQEQQLLQQQQQLAASAAAAADAGSTDGCGDSEQPVPPQQRAPLVHSPWRDTQSLLDHPADHCAVAAAAGAANTPPCGGGDPAEWSPAQVTSWSPAEVTSWSPAQVTSWSPAEVTSWLRAGGHADAAGAFAEQDIDGAALMLLRRTDVLACLGLKLGRAIKVFECVRLLQSVAGAE